MCKGTRCETTFGCGQVSRVAVDADGQTALAAGRLEEESLPATPADPYRARFVFGRPTDGIDLGLWTELGAERLTVALDTHVARIGRYIGLTERRSPGWAMARDVTDSLRRIDPQDPTRFDFALSHLGIMGACPRRRSASACARCDLLRVCRL